eukprot:CAMPEP_0172663894 /NCGR_PEP_ID=MMETSP1074-20121228/6236_1 /TAXON_ID=2916 /ORGANISM="Ceratium fusus, Strain PA161109" /LENGTH=384 /DNA_ID=CAMNT_0013479965 /DNA_START=95 /DNA_END=1249 /DNA_ORIENTATION=-
MKLGTSSFAAAACLLFCGAAAKCPGSNALVHAKCEVSVEAQADCGDAMAEMEARVAGIAEGTWHDPHNRGIYKVLGRGKQELSLQRRTGNGKYTDKLTFTFVKASPGKCKIQGCSESQGTSVADYSTNYCNLRMMYCGSAEGCKPVAKNFAIVESSVNPSFGAGKDPKACLAVPTSNNAAGDGASSGADGSPTCPPTNFSSVQGFNLKNFVQSRWHIQQQMPVSYLPASQNRCVYAEYGLLQKKSFWGYDVQVQNHAEDVAPPHKVHDSGSFLCAKVVDEATGKLAVAPCFLPSFAAGPYWVIAYNEADGYALISGGAPSTSAPGGCRTGEGVNNAGLWIFTRRQQRDEALVQKVRKIAANKGFDISVLNDVDQSDCGSSLLVV